MFPHPEGCFRTTRSTRRTFFFTCTHGTTDEVVTGQVVWAGVSWTERSRDDASLGPTMASNGLPAGSASVMSLSLTGSSFNRTLMLGKSTSAPRSSRWSKLRRTSRSFGHLPTAGPGLRTGSACVRARARLAAVGGGREAVATADGDGGVKKDRQVLRFKVRARPRERGARVGDTTMTHPSLPPHATYRTCTREWTSCWLVRCTTTRRPSTSPRAR